MRWRSSRPLWSDASFASVAPLLRSGCGAGRRPLGLGRDARRRDRRRAVHRRRVAALHNGRVDRDVLPADAGRGVGLRLGACWRPTSGRGGWTASPRPCATSRAAIRAATSTCCWSHPTRILGVTWGDALSYLVGPEGAEAGVAVASEPWDDDPGWVDVPDRHLIEVTPDGVAVTPLET